MSTIGYYGVTINDSHKNSALFLNGIDVKKKYIKSCQENKRHTQELYAFN